MSRRLVFSLLLSLFLLGTTSAKLWTFGGHSNPNRDPFQVQTPQPTRTFDSADPNSFAVGNSHAIFRDGFDLYTVGMNQYRQLGLANLTSTYQPTPALVRFYDLENNEDPYDGGVYDAGAGAYSSVAVVDYYSIYFWGALTTTYTVDMPTGFNITATPGIENFWTSTVHVIPGDLKAYWIAAALLQDNDDYYLRKLLLLYSGQVPNASYLGNPACPTNAGDSILYCLVDLAEIESRSEVLDSIHLGETFTFLMDTSYNLYGYGSNADGLLAANNLATTEFPTLIAVDMEGILGNLPEFIDLGLFEDIYLGKDFALGTFSYPRYMLVSWGSTTNPGRGVGSTSSHMAVEVVLPAHLTIYGIYVQFCAGSNVIVTGEDYYRSYTFSWGQNSLGELMDGSVGSRSLPKQVMEMNGAYYGWGALSTAGFGLAFSRSQWIVWGDAKAIALFSGNPHTVITEIAIENWPTHSAVSGIASTLASTTVITRSLEMYTFGDNTYGQLSVGGPASSKSAIGVDLANIDESLAGKPRKIIAGDDFFLVHTLSTDGDGYIYGWGDSRFGQLGWASAMPVPPSFLGNLSFDNSLLYLDVAAGPTYGIAIDYDNFVYAWGLSGEKALGNNYAITSTVASKFDLYLTYGCGRYYIGDSAVSGIAAGRSFVVFGCEDYEGSDFTKLVVFGGESIGWNYDDGHVIENVLDEYEYAVSWEDMCAGDDFAVLSTGYYLWSIGANDRGQLGRGPSANGTEIGLIPFDPTPWQFSCGRQHVVVVSLVGGLYTWGANAADGGLGTTAADDALWFPTLATMSHDPTFQHRLADYVATKVSTVLLTTPGVVSQFTVTGGPYFPAKMSTLTISGYDFYNPIPASAVPWIEITLSTSPNIGSLPCRPTRISDTQIECAPVGAFEFDDPFRGVVLSVDVRVADFSYSAVGELGSLVPSPTPDVGASGFINEYATTVTFALYFPAGFDSEYPDFLLQLQNLAEVKLRTTEPDGDIWNSPCYPRLSQSTTFNSLFIVILTCAPQEYFLISTAPNSTLDVSVSWVGSSWSDWVTIATFLESPVFTPINQSIPSTGSLCFGLSFDSRLDWTNIRVESSQATFEVFSYENETLCAKILTNNQKDYGPITFDVGFDGAFERVSLNSLVANPTIDFTSRSAINLNSTYLTVLANDIDVSATNINIAVLDYYYYDEYWFGFGYSLSEGRKSLCSAVELTEVSNTTVQITCTLKQPFEAPVDSQGTTKRETSYVWVSDTLHYPMPVSYTGPFPAYLSRSDALSEQFLIEVVGSSSITSTTELVATNARELTVTGTNFGRWAEQNRVKFSNPAIQATVTQTLVLGNAGGLPNAIVLQLNIPSSAPLGVIQANFLINGAPVSVPLMTLVNPPVVTPSDADISRDATSVTISGQNFASAGSGVELNFAGAPFPCVISSSSETEIICDVQFAAESSGTLLATVFAHHGSSQPTNIGTVGGVAAPNTGILSPDGSLSNGATAGIAVGVVVFVVAVALVLFLIYRRRQKKRMEEKMRQIYEVSDEFANLFNIKSDEINLIHKLGEGSYGAVFLGTYKKKHVAVKKLSGSALGQASEFFREASLMMSLKAHANIVRVYGICMEANNFSLVMEFVSNGALDGLIADSEAVLDENLIYKVSRGVAEGMKSLAAQKIVHRDLAARNILLGTDNEPKVSDFGYSRVVGQDGAGQTKADIGPIRWFAPECIREKQYSEKSDVWAYACIIYEMVAREEPYNGKDLMDVAIAIRDHQANPGVPAGTPSYLAQLLTLCWMQDSSKRPSFAQICEYLEEHVPENVKKSYTPQTSEGVGVLLETNRSRRNTTNTPKKAKKSDADAKPPKPDSNKSKGSAGKASNEQEMSEIAKPVQGGYAAVPPVIGAAVQGAYAPVPAQAGQEAAPELNNSRGNDGGAAPTQYASITAAMVGDGKEPDEKLAMTSTKSLPTSSNYVSMPTPPQAQKPQESDSSSSSESSDEESGESSDSE